MLTTLAALSAIIAAIPGAVVGALVVTSPRGLGSLVASLVKTTTWRNGWMVAIGEPASSASSLVRIIGRALGAFGAARLVLLAFGVGSERIVAIAVGLVLAAWDLYWLAFLNRMSFRAPAAAVDLQRTRVVLGLIVSVLMALLFTKL